MSRARQRVKVVAVREFIATVKRPGYVITLVLMPIFMAIVGVLPAVGLALSGGPQAMLGLPPPNERATIVLVDGSGAGIFDPHWVRWHNEDQQHAAEHRRGEAPPDALPVPDALKTWMPEVGRDWGGFSPEARFTFELAPDETLAKQRIEAGEAAAAWIVDGGSMDGGTARVLVMKRSGLDPGLAPARLAVIRLARRSLLGDAVDGDSRIQRIVRGIDPRVEPLVKPGAEGAASAGSDPATLLLPLLFSSFFGMSIFVASGYLLDGIGEEKENRVLEVLLATLRPEELLLGKMIGLGGAGLLQTGFFAVVGGAPLVAFGLFDLGPLRLLAMLISSGLGYALYASLMGASGAVAGNRHEGRQISAVWSLMAVSPMFVLPAFLARPDGGLAVGASLFPLTAPIAMTLRIGLSDVPIWQVLLAWVGIAAAALVAWRLGSRVFRVAILLTGARPSLRQIWRWLRDVEG